MRGAGDDAVSSSESSSDSSTAIFLPFAGAGVLGWPSVPVGGPRASAGEGFAGGVLAGESGNEATVPVGTLVEEPSSFDSSSDSSIATGVRREGGDAVGATPGADSSGTTTAQATQSAVR